MASGMATTFLELLYFCTGKIKPICVTILCDHFSVCPTEVPTAQVKLYQSLLFPFFISALIVCPSCFVQRAGLVNISGKGKGGEAVAYTLNTWPSCFQLPCKVRY